MTTDAEKPTKFKDMLKNGLIGESDFKKLTAGLTITGDHNTTP